MKSDIIPGVNVAIETIVLTSISGDLITIGQSRDILVINMHIKNTCDYI